MLYGAVAKRQMRRAPRVKIPAPVICVGNFTVGGAGKTPVAIALASAMRARGLKPGILSRGHGGSFGKPHLVDLHHDIARHVGDEPLLLAQAAPVAVSPDRAAASQLLLQKGCDILVMDDGFQSGHIHIDFALLVVDAVRGLGNGHVIPGGPLRLGLVEQLRFTDALLKVGRGEAADGVVRHAARAGRTVFEAFTQLRPGQMFEGQRYLAFAGIGNNEKFFQTLRQTGANVIATRSFPDHHAYGEDEIADLERSAGKLSARLITTEKDVARLSGWSPATNKFLEQVEVLKIETVFDNPTAPDRIIDAALSAYKRRRS